MNTLIPKAGAPPAPRGALRPSTYWDVQLGRYVEPEEPAWDADFAQWIDETAELLRRPSSAAPKL
jgi:hypothetical protein